MIQIIPTCYFLIKQRNCAHNKNFLIFTIIFAVDDVVMMKCQNDCPLTLKDKNIDDIVWNAITGSSTGLKDSV